METPLFPLFFFVLTNAIIIFLGYVFIKRSIIWQSWLTLIISILIIHLIFLHQQPILRMLALIATTFTAMKVVASTQSYNDKPLTLTFKQWLTFACGWAGMRPQPFETLGSPPLPNAWPLIRFGISRIIFGLLLILLAHKLVFLPLDHNLLCIAISAILLIAFSLILHFGLLNISAGIWRISGVNTYPLFKQPLKSTSLTEFWGKRWNIAFIEMTAITIFHPLKNKISAGAALLLSFAFSGLLHELALSVPVNSGYGLPTLYFMIQGVLVLIEKTLTDYKVAFLRNRIVAKVWTFFWIIAPAPLLFHPQFIKEIVWPLAGMKF